MGELTSTDDRTDKQRVFTIYKRAGSLVIVSDTACERFAGSDNGSSKTRIFQEVTHQFRAHGVRLKPLCCDQPD